MPKKFDENLVKAHAEEVTEVEIGEVVARWDEIEDTFVGRGPIGEFVEELLLGLSLVKDFATGRYSKVPYWVIGALVIMYLYLVNPVDLLPDYILGLGQIDDLIVITVCLLLVRQEIAVYKAWRQTQSAESEDDQPVT